MRDGSGDKLPVMVHRAKPDLAHGAPALLIHGLTGCEDSFYIRQTARQCLSQGRSAVRVNLRGAGPSMGRCRGQYHAGRSQDLRDLLAGLRDLEPELLGGEAVVAVGYSLGGNMLLKYLGEEEDRTPEDRPKVLAGASVSAPIDLKAAQLRIMERRNQVYHAYLLNRMKVEARGEGEHLPPELRDGVENARSVYEFDDFVVAPRNGFDGADDYYARCSARQFLPKIRVPVLAITARDDPWIPVETYETVAWRENPALHLLMAPGGGHVGFHQRDREMPWHDHCIVKWLDHLGV